MRLPLRTLLAVMALFGAGLKAGAADFYAVGGDYIYKFDTATGTRTTLLNQTSANFWGVATDGNGNVYASSFDSNQVLGRTSAGTAIPGYTTIAPGWTTIGVAYNPVNNQLTVARYNGTGSQANNYALSGGSPVGTTTFSLSNSTQGTDYDGAGNLYAAENNPGVTKNGTVLGSIAQPEFVFVDRAASKLYVSITNSSVRRYTLGGAPDTSFGINGAVSVGKPYGMAVADGFLFVANGPNINKYDLSGNLVTSAWGTSISGDFKGLTAFTVVPEPATWLLAAIAAGVTGLLARRRKAGKG